MARTRSGAPRSASARRRKAAIAARPSYSSGSGGIVSSAAGSTASSVIRARCRALFTEASLLSSIAATAAARKPSTSRRTSTARCRGRCEERSARDLVDELRLVVYPVLLGDGQRLLGETGDKLPLRLLAAETVGSGLALLRYERAREA